MADYKGYRFLQRPGKSDVIVSPYGDEIAILVKTRAGELVQAIVEGVTPRNDYKHRGEMLKDIADQHRAFIGETDEDPILTPDESRVIINGSVKNLQFNSNAFGVQISDEEIAKIESAVEEAPAETLKRVLKEWIPKAFGGIGVAVLVKMLGL